MKWFLLIVGSLLAMPAFAGDVQPDYTKGGGFAVYDTTISTTSSSIDTIYFGGMAVQETFECTTNPCSVSWHMDYKPIPVFGANQGTYNDPTLPTIPKGRRKNISFIQKTKAWTVGAGATANYAIPCSGMIVRGTSTTGMFHIQCLVRIY